MGRGQSLRASLAILGVAATSIALQAAPYASGIAKTGTTVNFILNEPADSLTYSINGGAAVTLDGTTKGLKSFTLGAATDSFSIMAEKNAATGYTISTGGTIALQVNGLSQDSTEAGFNLISDDANPLTRFNSPRGVVVSNNPNAPNFGTTYIGNSAAGVTAAPISRSVGDGLYALKADQSDAFGYGDTVQNPVLPDTFPAFTASPSSPWKLFVTDNGDLYASDWSDDNGQLFRVTPNLTSAINVFEDFGGPTPLPAGEGRNHGSIAAAYVEGSTAEGNLTVWTIDEDLTTNYLTGAGSTTDQNSLWRYDIGASAVPYGAPPTRVADVLIPLPNADVDRGADGKFYIAQNRNVGNEVGLVVTDDAGATLFNSLDATRALLGNPSAPDILRNIQGIEVTDDQKWIVLMLNNSDVAVVPLVAGLPDIAGRMVVNTGTDIASGRDISVDAAGNIHYVSSGQGAYRVLSTGGHTLATTSFDGTDYDFTIVPVGGSEDNADFDNDGDVDGADFLTWQRGVGTAGGRPEGNANGDAIIDGADLDIWQTQFGPGAPAAPFAGAVPEPSTWAMAALACVACLALAAPQRRAALARVKVAG